MVTGALSHSYLDLQIFKTSDWQRLELAGSRVTCVTTVIGNADWCKPMQIDVGGDVYQ
jgi:hypothetical protein